MAIMMPAVFSCYAVQVIMSFMDLLLLPAKTQKAS
jgi:hypothetical protein